MEKRLYRTPRNKVIGGVAGGLAEYFDIDPVIVRVIFVVTALAWGVSIIAYILLWIIVPENPKNRQEEFLSDLEPDYIREAEELYEKDKKSNRKFVGGIILIALGAVLLLKKMLPAMEWSYILPFFIILIGGYIIYTAYNSQNRGEEL
jgi:phage shock protein C